MLHLMVGKWQIILKVSREYSLSKTRPTLRHLGRQIGFVRKDNREFNTRKKDIKKRGGTRFGRGSNPSKRGGFTPGPNARVKNWAMRNIGFPTQQVAAKYNRSGALLACFKCGETGPLISQCPKKGLHLIVITFTLICLIG